MRGRVRARGGSNSSGPAGRVMAPAHLRCAEATGGLVNGAAPLYRAPQGGRMAPRGYAPLGIGLGRFLTCGRIQLVRRPVAGPMCSAGYAKNRLRPIFFTLPPHPGVHWTPGQARHRPGEPLVVREGPENRLSERGGVPRSGRITGAGGAQRPQAGLLRLRQGLGTSGAEKAASGPFNRVGRKSWAVRPGGDQAGPVERERLAGWPDGRAGPGRCGWPAWRPRPKVRVSGTDAPAR